MSRGGERGGERGGCRRTEVQRPVSQGFSLSKTLSCSNPKGDKERGGGGGERRRDKTRGGTGKVHA